MESLSKEQARKLVLISQRLPPAKQTGSAVVNTLSAIEHLGYIQIDTISAIQRAHHHTLWNRNPRYTNKQLDQLVSERRVFEYWSHAAAYLPMRDFRFSLPRKQAIANGEISHWYERDKRLMNSILKRIAAEGPLMAKDFEHSGKKTSDWSSKPAKRALENLYMQGDLMIPRRVNFHKVYDLTERVLPNDIDTSVPDPDEHTRHLITRFLEANGLGLPAEMAYLRPKTKPLVASTLLHLVSDGKLVEVNVSGQRYYAIPESLEVLNRPLSRSKLKILSPFDNLLIQRKRMQALFEFDYQIECYVTEAKRKYGYFSLPILWDGKLVARMDCKADRKQQLLHINHIALEHNIVDAESFAVALKKELAEFLRFNECLKIRLHKATPGKFKPLLLRNLKGMF